jgi:tricarballylate dehydrogenase
MDTADVIVVGGGNAAVCAALGAAEKGAKVLLLERSPKETRGGNSAFTGGAFRVVYDGVDDIRKMVPDLSQAEVDGADFGTYTREQYLDEWLALSQYRGDADLIEMVVERSLPTLLWLREQGVRFVPLFGRQTVKVGGKLVFWGGLTVESSGGGLGLMQSLYRKAESIAAIELRYGTRAVGLQELDAGGWQVDCLAGRSKIAFTAKSVILASGGFHANLEWRSKYLGKNWDLAKVRGSRYNTGDGIRMGLDAGAIPHGNWTGCHAVFFDANAAPFGDIGMLDQQKNYFTHGIVVNAEGKRFIDEGEAFRNYNYSQMGARVLNQPGGVAWQVFDQQALDKLPGEYRVRHATRYQADTLEALADKMEGIDKAGFLKTVREYNAAVRTDIPFNPATLDGRCTEGIAPAKTNWANRLEQPPYVAYAVTCGITCTYGGLQVNTDAQVLDQEGQVIPGLYAAGEMVGGLYYIKYAGGAGLTAGSVLGRAAGHHAAGLR